jgi:hypothetical protein
VRSLREEFVIGLDSAFFPAEHCGIRGLYIAEKIQNLANRLHPPVIYLAVQCGKLGSIALDNEHTVANNAQCPTNNFHNNLWDLMVLNCFSNLYMCDASVFNCCVKV